MMGPHPLERTPPDRFGRIGQERETHVRRRSNPAARSHWFPTRWNQSGEGVWVIGS
jgi:hypothetical protein